MTHNKIFINRIVLLYYFLFLFDFVLAVQVLPKRNNRLRFGKRGIKFPNSFAHLEINGKHKSVSSFEDAAIRRSLPWKYQQDIRTLFDENGVMYLPRLTKSVPYFLNDNFGKENGNFETPRHTHGYLKKLLEDILEDKNKHSDRKEDRRKKENGISMFLIQALRRRFGRGKERPEFEFSELVA